MLKRGILADEVVETLDLDRLDEDKEDFLALDRKRRPALAKSQLKPRVAPVAKKVLQGQTAEPAPGGGLVPRSLVGLGADFARGKELATVRKHQKYLKDGYQMQGLGQAVRRRTNAPGQFN
jgi:hypothetical protein